EALERVLRELGLQSPALHAGEAVVERRLVAQRAGRRDDGDAVARAKRGGENGHARIVTTKIGESERPRLEEARMRSSVLAPLFALSALAQESKPAKSEDDDDPRTPVVDLRANKDENKRYFLMGPTPKASVPKAGYRLLVVLPGGPGGPDFKTF